MKKIKGFTLIEILVVIAIISLLAGLLIPTIQAAMISAKISATKGQIRTIGIALQEYSTDFSGYFPPADCQNPGIDKFHGKKGVDNSSHALCVYLGASNTVTDDGSPSGGYAQFSADNLLYDGSSAFNFTVSGVTVVGQDDYVIDAFKNPIIYDERKSEEDKGVYMRTGLVAPGYACEQI